MYDKFNFKSLIPNGYSSISQQIRIATESWVADNIFCPSCGNNIYEYENNRPVADFYCKKCVEDYELKSKKDSMAKKIVDGAYSTMIERLKSSSNPSFFFLNYNSSDYNILNFLVVPKFFFTVDIIEKRKPLAQTAKRARWVGCNILLDSIPESGKIYYIKNGVKSEKNKILKSWNKTIFLKESKNIDSRGWLLDIIKCIERLNKKEFTLQDLYIFENYLKMKYPKNNNIQAKIRQQLQFLRDKNYLKFISKGKYEVL